MGSRSVPASEVGVKADAAGERGRSQTSRPPPGKWAVLGVVAIGVFMATLDTSIVNISLPAIAAGFGTSLTGAVEWVVISYLVVIAALLLTLGRLADLVGHRVLWSVGLLVFAGGSALCGAAPSLPALVGFRAFQGLGGALLMAISPAMLTAAFPPEQRGRALGLNASIVALGVSAGPTLGGIITEAASWRWIFYINPPIGLFGVLVALRVLRPHRARGTAHFDLRGAGLIAAALGALTAGLAFGPELGWGSWGTVALLGTALVATAALVALERGRTGAVLDLSLFSSRVFSSATGALVVAFMAMFAIGVMMPFYFEQLRHFSPQVSGLALTPLPLTIGLLAPLSGALSDRIGTRSLAAGGLAIATVGLVLLAFLDESSSLTRIILSLVVAGVGQALFQSPNNNALMGSAPRSRQGTAAGMLATSRVIGQSISVALAGAIFEGLGGAAAGERLIRLSHVGLGHGDADPAAATFVHSFRVTLLVCAAVSALGVPVSLVRGRRRRATAEAARGSRESATPHDPE